MLYYAKVLFFGEEVKYKAGDKVILKILSHFCKEAVSDINRLDNKEATIIGVGHTKINGHCYKMKEIGYDWYDWDIVGLVSYHRPTVVVTRFDLIDFED